MPNSPIIICDQIQKTYFNGNIQTKVLHNITFDIQTGEFVIITGPSGSGKSSLLYIITGLQDPTEGRIIVNERDITHLNNLQKAEFHQQSIGVVFQSYNLIPTLTIMQNIELPSMFARIDRKTRRQRAENFLEQFHLTELADKLPNQLSGGQQQRVGIIRSLMNDPPIIVGDEPTGNLDSVASKEVMDFFTFLNKQMGRTIVIVSHDASSFHYAHRLIRVKDGLIESQEYIAPLDNYKTLETTTQDELHQIATAKERKSDFRVMLSQFDRPETFDQRLLLLMSQTLPQKLLDNLTQESLGRMLIFLRLHFEHRINRWELYDLLVSTPTASGAGLSPAAANLIVDTFENIMLLPTLHDTVDKDTPIHKI